MRIQFAFYPYNDGIKAFKEGKPYFTEIVELDGFPPNGTLIELEYFDITPKLTAKQKVIIGESCMIFDLCDQDDDESKTELSLHKDEKGCFYRSWSPLSH